MNKETLTNYIVKGQWDQFFAQAQQFCAYSSQEDVLLSIKGRLARHNQDATLGLLSYDDKARGLAQIVNSAISILNQLDFTNAVTINASIADVTVNNTTVNNINVTATTATHTNAKFDPFYLAPEVTSRIETFMSLIRKYIILAAQVNMILPEIYDNCIEFIGEIQESLMSFVTSENSEERDEILESLEEYHTSLVELESTAKKEFKRAQGSEKNQVAQLLKAVAVGNKKNMELFKSAYAVFQQLDKADLVQLPKVLPVNATSLGLLVKKWIRLANS